MKRRDRTFDGEFVTGVLSTGIYCRPSCSARHPKRENVKFFASAEEAEAQGLRACLRCRPNEIQRDEAAIAQVIATLKQADAPPTLDQLGGITGYSPTHLQRIFKRATGLSPAAYARALRSKRAEDALDKGGAITAAVYDAGYGSASGFYENSKKRWGMTPTAWKNGGENTVIHWTIVPTYLGQMLIAATDKGVCRLSFNEDEAALRKRFPKAALDRGGTEFEGLVQQVVAQVERPGDASQIPLDVEGTAFQEAVWAALQKIPAGETRSYADIAAAVGRPKAVRAAGSANGANNVAVLIPCHRVVRSDGSMGGYAYGLDIKRKLLEREKR